MAHANNPPSGAEGWFNCAHWESDPSDSDASRAGTARHEWAAMILNGDTVQPMHESVDAPGIFYGEDEERDVAVAVNNVHARIQHFKNAGAVSVEMFIEQKLSIEQITGEPGAKGTSDVVLVITWADGTLQVDVIDHKFGYREVSAEKNKQGFMYVAAAVNEFSLVGDFTKGSFAVNQPAAFPTIHDYEFGMDELNTFVAEAGAAAERHSHPELYPPTAGPHCSKTYCANRATCPALRMEVSLQVSSCPATVDDFDHISDPTNFNEPDLARAMGAADLIEGWVKAVRAEVERRLLSGAPVPGYKIVQGKRGNRAWASQDDAEALLKKMRVPHDRMYDYKVISPTTAEKLFKEEVIGPRQWPKVLELITQADGKPSVAPESDKRPALVTSAVVDDFDDVTALPPPETEDLC